MNSTIGTLWRNLNEDSMEKVLGYLPKRDFPTAALLTKEWCQATRKVAERHNMRRGRILWTNGGWDNNLGDFRYLARIVTESNKTHVWSAAVATFRNDVRTRVYLTQMDGCVYDITVVPDYAAMDRGAGQSVVYPALAHFRDRTGAPTTHTNVIYVDTVDLLTDMARVPQIFRFIRASELLVRDPYLTCNQLQIAFSNFVRGRQDRQLIPHIVCTVEDLRKTIAALRAIDERFSPVRVPIITAAAPAGYDELGNRIHRVIGEAMAAEIAPLAFGIKQEHKWVAVSGPLPGTERKRTVRRGRGQALTWFHCVLHNHYVYTNGRSPPNEIVLFARR